MISTTIITLDDNSFHPYRVSDPGLSVPGTSR